MYEICSYFLNPQELTGHIMSKLSGEFLNNNIVQTNPGQLFLPMRPGEHP